MHVVLVSALVGVALASEGGPSESDADATALAASPECAPKIEAFGSCVRAAITEEAEGFTTAAKETLAEERVKGWTKKPPEFNALSGIKLPSQAPEAEECSAKLQALAAADSLAARCVIASLQADLAHWGRREKSRFGDALAADGTCQRE